jgi:hypothetical protein
MIDSTLSWKEHIDWLMSKLGSASYAVRTIKSYTSLESMRSVYFSYFHSIMTYVLIFWGNSPLCICIFRLQKRVIRVITNSRSRDSCRELFKKLKILPLCSQYIFSQGTYYFGIKIFNKIPPNIKDQAHEFKKFKSTVKRFLFLNSFYSLEEYYNCDTN